MKYLIQLEQIKRPRWRKVRGDQYLLITNVGIKNGTKRINFGTLKYFVSAVTERRVTPLRYGVIK